MNYIYQEYLAHHGILGQKWGVRRYQNEDGTLTEEGRKHYQKELDKDVQKNWTKVHNAVAARSQSEFAKINSKPEYKDGFDFDNIGKTELKYLREIADADNRMFIEEANKAFKNNPAWTEQQVSKIPTYGQYERMYQEALAEYESKHKR